MRARRAAGLLLAALLAAVGCGGDGMGDVSGAVTVDGQPLDDGTITFFPANGQGPTAGGKVAAGKYSARVAVGPTKVTISAPKVVGKKKIYPTPESPEMPITKEALPDKYSATDKTELTFDVKPGRNQKDWDLKTK